VVRLLARGEIKVKGVLAPETLGAVPTLVDEILKQHADRGITYRRTDS
jgi:hypothetical protein